MAEPRKSAPRRSKPDAAPPGREWVGFPALLTLVAGAIVPGAFFYSAVPAVFPPSLPPSSAGCGGNGGMHSP